MQNTDERRFLTVLELASYLRVSRTRAYRLVKDGDVPSLWVGGLLRIPREELDRQLTASTMRKPAA